MFAADLARRRLFALPIISMNIVQSLWIGPLLSPLQQMSVSSFLANGHPFHLYSYDPIDGVPEGTTLCDAATILPRESIFCYQNGFGKGSHSAFSNLFRYKLLLDRGGWWVDTDLVCLKPFDFAAPYVFATETDSDWTIQRATCAIRCPQGAPILQHCYDVAHAADKQTLEWGQIGPQLFSSAVTRFGLDDFSMPTETFNPINFFEFEALRAPAFDISRLHASYAVHFWNQMWKNSETDPLAVPPSDSLYGMLLAKYAPSARRESVPS